MKSFDPVQLAVGVIAIVALITSSFTLLAIAVILTSCSLRFIFK